MTKLKHIAITSNNPLDTANFFIDALGLSEVERTTDNEAIMLTDGYMSVAILKFKPDRYGGGHPGLNHLGFKIDNLTDQEQVVLKKGGQELSEWNEAYSDSVGEKKYMSPEGISFDLNPTGWNTSI